MSRNLIIGLCVSVLLHCIFFFGGQLLKAHPAPKAVKKETPTVELMPIPPVEPDKVEDIQDPAEKPDISDIVPPMQPDVPSVSESPFLQTLQPPPPPGAGNISMGITIPTGNPGRMGAGLGGIFDMANLDQQAEAIVKPAAPYPYDLKMSRIQGEVRVGFVVDTDGNVHDPYIISSTNRGFEKTVLQTVIKWKFKPGKKDGVAVRSRFILPYAFTLGTE
jgi:protein TonB